MLWGALVGAITVGSTASRCAPVQPHRTPWATVDAEYHGTGPEVSVLGDSITNSGHDLLHAALGGYAVRVASIAGEGLGGGPWRPEGQLMREVAGIHAAADPDVAVIALGTNDAWEQRITVETSVAALLAIEEAYGDACIVGVLASETATAANYDTAEADGVNEAMQATVDVVVDPMAAMQPGDISPDTIHLNPTGSIRWAALVAQGVRACTSTPTTTTTGSPTTTTEGPPVETTTTSGATTTTTEAAPPETTTTTTTEAAPPETTTTTGAGGDRT